MLNSVDREPCNHKLDAAFFQTQPQEGRIFLRFRCQNLLSVEKSYLLPENIILSSWMGSPDSEPVSSRWALHRAQRLRFAEVVWRDSRTIWTADAVETLSQWNNIWYRVKKGGPQHSGWRPIPTEVLETYNTVAWRRYIHDSRWHHNAARTGRSLVQFGRIWLHPAHAWGPSK